MAKLTFNSDLCKGCGLCVEACPKGLLYLDTEHLNLKGYNYAAIKDQSACIACAFCAKICPDCIIKVEK